MKTSEMFKAAKRLVKHTRKGSGEEYICFALEIAFGYVGSTPARKVIVGRIAPFQSAESWLMEEGMDMTFEERQLWRHMWLDQLIAEFEAKGD